MVCVTPPPARAYPPPPHRVHRDAASSSSLRHPPHRRALPQPRKASRASQVDRPRSSRRRWQPRTKSLGGPSAMATAVHPSQVRRKPLSNMLACASIESRGICVRVRALPTRSRPSPALWQTLWLLRLHSLSKHSVGGCRGVARARQRRPLSLSPQRRTPLSLAAAPDASLSLGLRASPSAYDSSLAVAPLLSPGPVACLPLGWRANLPSLSLRWPTLHPPTPALAGVHVLQSPWGFGA